MGVHDNAGWVFMMGQNMQKTVRGEYIGIPKVNKSIVDDRLGLGHKTESKAEDAAKIIAENYINDK